jgi:6,7-dimethyl-8-ribityllumazine synthase
VVRTIEGSLVVPDGARFAIVAGRFNDFIVDRLLEGAVDALIRHGARPENITAVRVPGSREMSLVIQRLARTKQFDAIIAVSAVIKGATAHFDYVAGDISSGVSAVALETGIPVTFGVLTTDTIEQAIERAGTKAGNKGFDAAVAAIEMVTVGKALSEAGL